MNVENILRVAYAIEQHSIPNLGFNMAWTLVNADSDLDKSGHKCGTVACIAGWSVVLIKGMDAALQAVEECCVMDIAESEMGLTSRQANDLFIPSGMSKLSDTDAVRTLRHLAATGEVNWDLPESAAA